MKHIDHIGIAVKSIADSASIFETLLNTTVYKTEIVASENVTTAFLKTGETKIELVQGNDPDGVISRYIDKKGEGMHHIAFEVEDINKEMERLKNEGFELVNDQPRKGADNKLVCFLKPKTTNGVLIEICQEIR